MVDRRKLIVYLGAFIGPLASNAVLALVPELRQEFMASTSAVLLSITFFMLPFAIFSLFSGAFSDVYGRKKVLYLGLTTYAIGCAITALAQDLGIFYISRAVQGIGFALVQPVLLALLGDIVPKASKAKAMGMFTAATTLGIALGPFVAGLISVVDWRIAFLLIALVTALLFLLLVLTRDMPEAVQKVPHVRAVGKALRTAVANHGVMALAVTGLLHVLCYIGTQAFISDHISRPSISAPSETIGTVLALAGLMGLIGARAGGELVQRMGIFRASLIGNLIMLASIAMMLPVNSIEIYATLLSTFSIGSAIAWSAQLTMAVEIFPYLRGTVSSLFTSAGFFGGSIAPIVFSPFYDVFGIAGVQWAIIAVVVSILPIFYFATRSMTRRADLVQ